MEINDHVLEIGLEQILKIANERLATIEKLKKALIADDVNSIKEYAKQLCGLSNEN